MKLFSLSCFYKCNYIFIYRTISKGKKEQMEDSGKIKNFMQI